MRGRKGKSGAKVLSPLPKFPNSSRMQMLPCNFAASGVGFAKAREEEEDIAVALVCRSVPLFLGQIRRLARLVVFCRTGTESGGVAVAVVDRRRGRVLLDLGIFRSQLRYCITFSSAAYLNL